MSKKEPTYPEVKRVMDLVRARLGDPTVPDFARAIDYPAYQQTGLIRKWWKGETRPSFEYILPMLSRAGLLHEDVVNAYWGKRAPLEKAKAKRSA